MPIRFDCPHCDKSLSVGDEHAGKKARCKRCDQVIHVPAAPPSVSTDSADCPGCGEPVLPTWNICPFCQVNLASQSAPPPPAPQSVSPPPFVQAGNENVIKATVHAPTNTVGDSNEKSTQGSDRSAIAMGDGNVVKANIDQSTRFNHDHSVHVRGQYVAQQTVVQESSVGTIMKMLTSPFTNKDADQIDELIEAIPDGRTELLELLRKSLLQLVRQMKMEFKQAKNEGLGLNSLTKSYGKFLKLYLSTLSFGMLDKVWSKKDITVKRIELCQKILDKLHDSAIRDDDQELLARLDTLDDHLISLQSLSKKNEKLKTAKPIGYVFAIFLGIMVLAGLAASFGAGESTELGALIFSAIFFGLITAGFFGYSWKTETDFENEIKYLADSVRQLLGNANSK